MGFARIPEKPPARIMRFTPPETWKNRRRDYCIRSAAHIQQKSLAGIMGFAPPESRKSRPPGLYSHRPNQSRPPGVLELRRPNPGKDAGWYHGNRAAQSTKKKAVRRDSGRRLEYASRKADLHYVHIQHCPSPCKIHAHTHPNAKLLNNTFRTR